MPAGRAEARVDPRGEDGFRPIFMKKGLTINDIHETMSKYHILNTDEKINRVIEDLKQENFQNHPKTQQAKLLKTLNKQDATSSKILKKTFQKTAGIFLF